MSEQRFSFWQVTTLVAAVVVLCTASLAGGLFLGFQWGRANGLARAGRNLDQAERFSLPAPRDFGRQDVPVGGPYLGVRFEMLTPELAKTEGLELTSGALLRAVEPGSPAEAAGLRAGDVILSVGGTFLDERDNLRGLVSARRPGDTVTLEVQRGGEKLSVEVTLAERTLPVMPFDPEGQAPGFHFQFTLPQQPQPDY